MAVIEIAGGKPASVSFSADLAAHKLRELNEAKRAARPGSSAKKSKGVGRMMRKIICSATLLLMTSVASAYESDFITGKETYEGCRQIARDERSQPPNLMAYAYCMGVIAPFIALGSRADVFPPYDSTIRQGAAIIVRFMDAHPEWLQRDLAVIAWGALSIAWPCK
jgi:hypothetical protein